MKTLPVKLRFVVIGVAVIVAVVSCCNFPLNPIPDILYSMEIGHAPGARTRGAKYVEWKGDGSQFKAALEHVCSHHGGYDLFVLLHDTDQHPEHWKKNCNSNSPGKIKTVKITKSETATDIAAGAAINDPHATYTIRSPDPKDIKEVVAALSTTP